MAVTLKDVAHSAGVSVRTVSNVIGGHPHVSLATRSRVEAAIEKLGYRANPIARTLRTGKTGVICLAVPEIAVPYFSELASHVISHASTLGYKVVVLQTLEDPASEKELLLGGSRALLYDGVLYSPHVADGTLLRMRKASAMPLVFLGEYTYSGEFDHVTIDNEKAGYEAATHLIARGWKKIAIIGAQPSSEYVTPRLRLRGCIRAIKEANLAVVPEFIRAVSHYGRAEGYAVMRSILAEGLRPDAVVCFSDLLAIGAIRAIFDLGLSVPNDIAIIGIDNTSEGEFFRPSLSTVALDRKELAIQAVQRLVAIIEYRDCAREEVVVPYHLIPRESTMQIR